MLVRAIAPLLLTLLASTALAAPPKTAPRKEDTCPFLSKDEANAVVGGAAVKVKRQDPEGGTTCLFLDVRGFEAVSVTVQPAEPNADAYLVNTKKWLAKIYPKDPIVPVDGLGEAFWAPKPGYVMVRKGELILTAKARPKSGSLSPARAPSEAIARKVSPRVK